MFLRQPSRWFGHDYMRLGFDDLDQEGLTSHLLAASRRAALTGRGQRAEAPLALHQLDGTTATKVKMVGRRPTGMSRHEPLLLR